MPTNKHQFYKKRLAETRAELQSLLASLDEEQWQTLVFSEGNSWTVLDVVAHLIENERAMSIHVHKIQQRKATVPEDFDIHEWNAGLKERMGNPTPQQLLESLAETRIRTLEKMDTIKGKQWYLMGHHPVRKRISIEQYYETIFLHEMFHTIDIKKALGVA
jgi:uncharacterized protein (TIGR03083 family)